MLTGEESNYIVICMLGPYGDSLYSDRENQIILEYTSQTVLAFVNGKMERMQSN